MKGPCPICKNKWIISHESRSKKDRKEYNCYRCGIFSVFSDFEKDITPKLTGDQSSIISSWIFRHQGNYISSDLANKLMMKIPTSVGERAENLLVYISRNVTKRLGGSFSRSEINDLKSFAINSEKEQISKKSDIDIKKYSHMLSISESCDTSDLLQLLDKYLGEHKKFIDPSNNDYRITCAGWDHIHSIQSSPSLDKCFIAMKYDDEKKITGFFESITARIENKTSYKVVIMKDHSHSNIIEDEMKNEIRGSKFVIADLTQNSRGAYYEAGYAHGLGIPVIFTINRAYLNDIKNDKNKKDQLIHFDTNHYVYKKWDYNSEAQDKFTDWLICRILADERIGPANKLKS